MLEAQFGVLQIFPLVKQPENPHILPQVFFLHVYHSG